MNELHKLMKHYFDLNGCYMGNEYWSKLIEQAIKTDEAKSEVKVEPEVMLKLWEVSQEKTEDHWLEIKDPEGWYYAVVKWDGCIHFNRYYNAPKDEQEKDSEDNDYLHICSVDDMVKRLQALKEEAVKHFGDGWES